MGDIFQEILKAEDNLLKAMIASDVASLENSLSNDLQFILQNGLISTKQMDLEAHSSGELKIRELIPSERTVKIWGDTAVVTSKASLVGLYGGVEFKGLFRYLRTWIKIEGRWQVAAGAVVEMNP